MSTTRRVWLALGLKPEVLLWSLSAPRAHGRALIDVRHPAEADEEDRVPHIVSAMEPHVAPRTVAVMETCLCAAERFLAMTVHSVVEPNAFGSEACSAAAALSKRTGATVVDFEMPQQSYWRYEIRTGDVLVDAHVSDREAAAEWRDRNMQCGKPEILASLFQVPKDSVAPYLTGRRRKGDRYGVEDPYLMYDVLRALGVPDHVGTGTNCTQLAIRYLAV